MTKKTQKAQKAPRATLAVTIDGEPMTEADARALWEAFSRHMDEHEGDAPGFAKSRGFASTTPTYARGQAVLVVKTRA